MLIHHAPKRAGIENDAAFRWAAFRVVGSQILMTAFLAAVCLAWATPQWAYSAAVGGLICVIPGAYLVARMFRGGRDRTPAGVLRRFYLSEVVKVALTTVMFAIAILYLDLNLLVMFLAYGAATMVYWFALVASDGRRP